jgi:hypothetical protein
MTTNSKQVSKGTSSDGIVDRLGHLRNRDKKSLGQGLASKE